MIALIISYILFSPLVIGSFYDGLLFFPDRKYYPEVDEQLEKIMTPLKVTKEDIFIPVRNKSIHAWYFNRPLAKKTFLISHGNGGNVCHRLYLIKALLPYGSVFVYDYEGYGKSEGTPSRQAICADGLAAYDYLIKQKFVRPDDVIVFGESLGCSVSCEISKYRKTGGIILQSGWTSLLKAGRDRIFLLRLYPDCFFKSPYLDNEAALCRPHPPVLLIHGQKDKILPCRYSQELFVKACEPKQLVLLPNASHNDIGIVDSDLYAQAIHRFLQTYYQNSFY